ncbi:acylhydrolase [Paraburkholderia sp. Ac-20336]|uniref:SGNH/GDSL hydrolase family protein n=1 Tax=unclassified Paraburkholderia TaxID=2615204 RepID=UPI00141EDCA0|nr:MULTISPECIES: SGNH/GDSL hydrolase family protein [unclassified Paraburkholderia]MBN3805169.1 acylhydrolase [Paraburkholderia sp. Ac-20336]MBN3849201.1 acylhydrolase [Paraburkholderia sp. Ac-20342]NIF79062.1 acylhydrolase [Paraburkholderia sp. Cy-641]
MNQAASKKQQWVRVTQIAVASAAFAALAACGGGGDDNSNASSTPPGGVKLQIVSFGDSLSDVGTYGPSVQASVGTGGGRFTTNPGEVWTQKVAEYYGDTLSAAYVGGFGQPLTANGGLGYAQGGSRVDLQPGEGYAPNNLAATTVPITAQVTEYLSAHGSFNANQLVLMNGGANDVFIQAQAVSDAGTAAATQVLESGGTAADAQTAAATASQAATVNALQAIGVAAATFVGTVQKVIASGATHVVVSDIPDIAQTPQGLQAGAQGQALFSALVQTYNGVLQQQLASNKQVIYVSAYAWQDQTMANYQSLGFTVSNTGTACNLTSMATNATNYATKNPAVLLPGQTAAAFGSAFASSLFCSPQTYTVAGADQTYMFADLVHPTTHLHLLFAQQVEKQVAASGLGK